jgi:hypothetical protein
MPGEKGLEVGRRLGLHDVPGGAARGGPAYSVRRGCRGVLVSASRNGLLCSFQHVYFSPHAATTEREDFNMQFEL